MPDRSFRRHGDQALALWRDVVASYVDYSLKPLPLIVTPESLVGQSFNSSLAIETGSDMITDRHLGLIGRTLTIDPISAERSLPREKSHLCTGTFGIAAACFNYAETRVLSEKGQRVPDFPIL